MTNVTLDLLAGSPVVYRGSATPIYAGDYLNAVALTQGTTYQGGAAWFSTPLALPVTVEFSFGISEASGGSLGSHGDGLTAMVIDANTDLSTLTPVVGAGIGLPNGKAVWGAIWDCYQNAGELTAPFIGIGTTSGGPLSYSAAGPLGGYSSVTGLHTGKVIFAADKITVFHDGVKQLETTAYAGQLPSLIKFGFSSANGLSVAVTGVTAATVSGGTVDSLGYPQPSVIRNANNTATVSWPGVLAPAGKSLLGYEIQWTNEDTQTWSEPVSVATGALSWVHDAAHGYLSLGKFQYSVAAIYLANLGETQKYASDPVNLTGQQLLFSKQQPPGFGISYVAYEPDVLNSGTVDRLSFKVKLPHPSGGAISPTGVPIWASYRVSDVATSQILEGTKQGGLVQVAESDSFPITVSLADIAARNSGTTPLGTAGFRVDIAYQQAVTKPTVFDQVGTGFVKVTTDNYYEVYFYPNGYTAPPESKNGDQTYKSPDKRTGGTTSDPVPGLGVNEMVITPTPVDETGTVCLENQFGETLACGQLPAGTPVNPTLTLRRDGEYVFLLFAGKVVVTYKIDAVKFPMLSLSTGWVAFYDRRTGLPLPTQPDGTFTAPPLTGYAYNLFAMDVEPPTGFSHTLWKYGVRNQAYTLMWDTDGHVSADIEPVDIEVQLAPRAYPGGFPYVVSSAVATDINNAGFGRWLTEVSGG